MTTGTTPTPVTVERLRELKPCPFCGERAEALTHSGQGPITYYVTCMYCCAEFSGGADMQSAIEGWNRRTVPDVRLPQGVKRIDDRRLDEIVSGYTEFPEPDCFEIRSLGYEVRNWRMRSPAVKQATACGDTEGLARDAMTDWRNGENMAVQNMRTAESPLTTPQGEDELTRLRQWQHSALSWLRADDSPSALAMRRDANDPTLGAPSSCTGEGKT